MDTKSDDQFIAIEATIEANKQDSDKKHQEFKAEMKDVKESINKLTTLMMDQINISKSSPAQKDTRLPSQLIVMTGSEIGRALPGIVSSALGSGILCSWVTKGFVYHFPTRHFYIRRIQGYLHRSLS